MNLRNYKDYCFFTYESSDFDYHIFDLGDVVINGKNEIGVIIQLHPFLNESKYPINSEVRTDMFGNESSYYLRLAKQDEIKKYRPELFNEILTNKNQKK
ncbi:MAG: hypothetical protein LBE36_06720 [Flavobacteriaceae bacterium]|jgi:hypothetical protein|nr:hypothetical protein [Flavobacteriaceae bacterium]